MAKSRLTRSRVGNIASSSSRGVARFSETPAKAKAKARSIPQVAPIKFTAGGAYMEQMAAVADLGVGIFNATTKVAAASEAAKKVEQDAYLADIKSDDIIQTNRIYNENTLVGNDPKGLTEKLEGYKTGKMASMPENIKAGYSQSFDKRAAVLTTRSQDAFFKKVRDDASASLEASKELILDDIFNNPAPLTEIESEANSEKMASYMGILQAQVTNKDLTEKQAQVEAKEFQKKALVLGVKTQIKTLNPDQRAAEIKRLNDLKTLPAGMNEQDRQDMVAQLNAYDSTLRSIEGKAAAKEKADVELNLSREAADLEIGVNRGESTYEDVLRAEQEGTITPTKKVQLFKLLDNNLKKVEKEAVSLIKVAKALRAEAFIDPKSTDDKKAVDLSYQKVLKPQIDSVEGPAAKKQIITNFVGKLGIVPETLRGEMRGVFRGNDVEQKVFYADLVGMIQETKPQALDDFDTKDITQAVMIDEMVKAGTPNEQAVEKVTALTEGINAGRLEILREDFKNLVEDTGTGVRINSEKVIDTVRSTFEHGVFNFNASLPQQQLGVESAAINDYKKLYKTWYLSTNGDADLAKKQAQKALKRTWGTTDVNRTSNQLTKYPIEKAYPGMPVKEIKKELIVDIKALEAYRDIDPDDVIIQWDARTAREYSKYPSYQVLVFNKEGLLEPVVNKTHQRWSPDYIGFQKKKKKKKADIFKEVKEGRDARAINITNS